MAQVGGGDARFASQDVIGWRVDLIVAGLRLIKALRVQVRVSYFILPNRIGDMRNACVAFDLHLEFEYPPATSFALGMYIAMIRRVMAIVPTFLDFGDPPDA